MTSIASQVQVIDDPAVIRLFQTVLADLTALRSFFVNLHSFLLLTASAVAIGTDPTKIGIGAFDYQTADGEQHSVVAADKAFTIVTDDIPRVASLKQECIWVLSMDTSAVVSLTKGVIAGEGLAVAPTTPVGQIKLGEVKIQHNGLTKFEATVDDLDAAHLTTTYTAGVPTSITTPPALTLTA